MKTIHEGNSLKLKNGELTLDGGVLIIRRKTLTHTVILSDIKATKYRFLPSAIIIKTDRKRYVISGQASVELQAFRHAIDRAAGLGAFAGEKYAIRTPYIRVFSAFNAVMVFFALALLSILALVGALMFPTETGAAIGSGLVAIGVFIFGLVIGVSTSGIAGHCPLCGEKSEASLMSYGQSCVKCGESFYIKRDYFEHLSR